MESGEDERGHFLLFEQAGGRSIARHVTRALIALIGAYVLTRCGAALLFDDATIELSRLALEVGGIAVAGSLALLVVSALPIRNELLQIQRVVAENDRELRDRNRGQRFLRNVQNAFEMAEYENELFDVAGLALRDAGPGRAEILVADASNAHVERVAVATGRDAPGCGVTTPKSCPAVRQGHTLRFGDPNGLAACPRLRERSFGDGAVATCVPVNILGTPSAVLHAVYDADVDGESPTELPQGVRALEGVGVRFGARIGMMRAMTQSRLQADTDPLTGLMNRRAMENRVREIRSDHVPFALALADLDHFKDLNDTYGHDTGDRALRLFARVAKSAVRDGDLVCRHGGEEFVLVLAGADVTTAAPVMHRLRQQLADAFADAQLPEFTVSAGLVDSTWATDLPDLVQAADRALMQAKSMGRDRIVIDDPTSPPLTTTEQQTQPAAH